MNNSSLEYELRIIDQYVDTMKIYWNTLLIMNGLLLTFFSINALTWRHQGVEFHYVLIGFCIVSLWLLLWNFRTIKSHYYELGTKEMESSEVPEELRNTAQTEEKMRQVIDDYTTEYSELDLAKVQRRNSWIATRENVVEIFFVAETILVVLILIFGV